MPTSGGLWKSTEIKFGKLPSEQNRFKKIPLSKVTAYIPAGFSKPRNNLEEEIQQVYCNTNNCHDNQNGLRTDMNSRPVVGIIICNKTCG